LTLTHETMLLLASPLLLHAGVTSRATTQIASLDAKCTGNSRYVHSNTYSARVSTWGNIDRGGWRGAVLGPNKKIYGIPTNATTVLEIDPATRKLSTFGDFGAAVSPANCSGTIHCGLDKWIGGVLAPTGKIIGIPYAAESVLEIDPETHEVSTFGVISSSVHRKWVEGVLARNGKIYAIPYDADRVLEIDPVTHALEAFGDVGPQQCKWYGGVLGPNGKIYTIPYASQFILEISPEQKTTSVFATVGMGWGKWSGGVLAKNGKIYGIPALATSVLEIDINARVATPYGMLPGGEQLQDKWNGGVLAPNGNIYGIPWRSGSILEFDPETKFINLFGKLTSTNFTWHGGVVISNGRIVAVPYNSARILEIGERVCMSSDGAAAPDPVKLVAVASSMASEPVPTQNFILALPGCPDDNNDACFNFGHRTWHSVMITLLKPETSLYNVRKQVSLSRFSHVPSDFCFLYKGHALDPSVEVNMKAMKVAVHNEDQHVVFADTIHCTVGKESLVHSADKEVIIIAIVICVIVALLAFRVGVHYRFKGNKMKGYQKVSVELEEQDESIERTKLCRVSKVIKKKNSRENREPQLRDIFTVNDDDVVEEAKAQTRKAAL